MSMDRRSLRYGREKNGIQAKNPGMSSSTCGPALRPDGPPNALRAGMVTGCGCPPLSSMLVRSSSTMTDLYSPVVMLRLNWILIRSRCHSSVMVAAVRLFSSVPNGTALLPSSSACCALASTGVDQLTRRMAPFFQTR